METTVYDTRITTAVLKQYIIQRISAPNFVSNNYYVCTEFFVLISLAKKSYLYLIITLSAGMSRKSFY